jgi:predicted nucleotidyltransferase
LRRAALSVAPSVQPAQNTAMTRGEAIARLKDCASAIQARGATSLYLFGSSARDEAGPESDLNLFIDYDPARRFSLVDRAAIKNILEDRLTTEIGLTTRDSLHPLLRDRIVRSAVRMF